MEIKLIPTGGLCNRLRAIATTLAIAQRYDCPVTIYWNNYAGLRADFVDLFKPLNAKRVTVVKNDRWLYRVLFSKDYLLRMPFLLLTNEQVVFNHNMYTQGDIYSKLKASYRHTLMLISCYPMCRDYDIRHLFVPQDDLQERISKVTARFPRHTIGIHIRRTDNKVSIKASPLSLFIDIMQKEIGKDEEVKFYVASDDEKVKRTLTERFPGRIITLLDDTSRDSLGGMKFAVVDLYCLSSTSKIIGSVNSSYSQIAAEIGGIEIEYAKQDGE